MDGTGAVSSGWLKDWEDILDKSAGVLVLNSGNYRSKYTSKKDKNPVRMEADLIISRKKRDPSFVVYVLDPDKQSMMCFPANVSAFIWEASPGYFILHM